MKTNLTLLSTAGILLSTGLVVQGTLAESRQATPERLDMKTLGIE